MRIDALGGGAYFVRAESGEASPANRGFVSNIGVIAGRGGVIVIGTGASAEFGERLLRRVEQRFRLPVVLAINTQATPDHVLGNTAFARRGIPLLAHRETADFMVQNCRACIQRLADDLGAAASPDYRFALPNRRIEHSQRIRSAGRELELLYFGPTFQPGSIALLDRASGVAFAGEMVGIDHVPDLRNADIENWRRALAELQRLPIRVVVPGHGAPAPPARMADTSAYLGALRAEVERAYRRGISMLDAARTIRLTAFRDWAQYDVLHAGNVHFVYLTLEREELARE